MLLFLCPINIVRQVRFLLGTKDNRDILDLGVHTKTGSVKQTFWKNGIRPTPPDPQARREV